MTVQNFFIVFLCLSVASVAAAVITGIVIYKKARKADRIQKRTTLTPFHVFLIGFFLASVFMFYPIYSATHFDSDNGFVCFIKSLLMSVLNTLQIFFLNGDFSGIGESVGGAVTGGLGTGYVIYSNILHVVAPVLTFGFILSFFREAISMLKYVLHPFTDVYVISELNESSIELAKDIFKKSGKKQVIFTDVFEKNDEEIFELVTEAKRLGAICLKKDITELGLKHANIKRKLFFISRNEDENLRQALTIINRLKDTKYDKDSTHFYVFASNAESAALLDVVEHGNMKVRRINERHNLIIDTLYNQSVFATALPDKNGVKHINACIVGLGTYGTELLKALCYICQLPNYKLTIDVFDGGNGEEHIKSIAPELYELNKKNIRGDAYYEIYFHNNVNVNSVKFQTEIAKLKDLTVAFVTLGTDEQNIETAMNLRKLLARQTTDTAPPFPPIYTVVYSALKNEIVMSGADSGLKGIPDIKDGKPVYNNDYGIKFIGNISVRYSLDVIEQTELEKDGLRCHNAWSESELNTKREELRNAKTDEEIAKLTEEIRSLEKQSKDNLTKYERHEYFRSSSIAQAVHKKYMTELCPELFDNNGEPTPEGQMYEHSRWNAYMRGEGYVLPQDKTHNRKNHIAKLHYLLVPFDKLDRKDVDKDKNVKTK